MLMAVLTLETWLAIGVVIAIGVFLMLRALSSSLRDVQRVIELRAQVAALRGDHERKAEAAKSRRGLTPLAESGPIADDVPHKVAA